MEGVVADLSADRRRPSVKIQDERASPESKARRTVEGPLVPDALRTPPGLPEKAARTAPERRDRVAS
eukprot:12597651-Heterocapsa_arctica.AAC.1